MWICMELMDKSLHDLYKLVYEKLHLTILEWVVGKMAEAVSLPPPLVSLVSVSPTAHRL